ncbi:hypothetical protein SLITK23_09520 [Streptomyces lividans]|uniref:Uncharacterized protein n=1 Tax=Streptomyces lividans 1326 TaxID=1200984 RepID=A0A7U9DP95_STRLI|nr:predicted protein [Streptomyces lividans TK24]EOY45950.1 hypothetical protein SLI_1233 [Streptomyces lividans 1326]BDE37707.1 hypothetical protein SLITK23_09520 [Streptomyces lividans]
MERISELTLRDEPREPDYPDSEVLLTIVNAVRHCRPVPVHYGDRDGRRTGAEHLFRCRRIPAGSGSSHLFALNCTLILWGSGTVL